MLFDNKLLELHRDYAAENLHKSDFLIKFAAEDIIDHIEQLGDDFTDIIELGGRTGHLSTFFLKKSASFIVTDNSQKMLDNNPANTKLLLNNDADLPFALNTADLIVSSMNLHWINNVPNYLKQISLILKPNGAFIVNFIGNGSFDNLKKLFIEAESSSARPHSMHVIPLIPAENIYRLFQEAGFKFIVVNTQKLDLEYDTPIRLMKELKNMGENNSMINNITPLPRAILSYNNSFEDSLTLVTAVVRKTTASYA
jgi:NADH dehydrogenase [ubiquinone] 1 alpha subcomplex assembly factor 5